jgi:hypothetical protein
MTQASSSTDGGSQGPPPSSSNPWVVKFYLMKGDNYIETRAHDYEIPKTNEKGKEAISSSIPLWIDNMMGETMARIPKGVFKKSSHNLNVRTTHNYSLVEDLSQTPCVISSLEVL